MRYIKITTVLCAGLIILISCKNPLSGNLNDSLNDIEFVLGEEFEIGFDKSGINTEESIQVMFTEVFNEGRCPADVMCVWAGNARIGIKLTSNMGTGNIELNTHSSLPKVVNFETYSVRLVNLFPYPQSSQNPIPEGEYVATLLVERNN